MRHRKLPKPQPAIDAAVDSSPLPGQVFTLADELLELGVPAESVPAVEAVIYRESFRSAGEMVRRLMLSLDRRSPGARALQAAVLGLGGETFEQASAGTGQNRSSFFRSVERIRARIEKLAA